MSTYYYIEKTNHGQLKEVLFYFSNFEVFSQLLLPLLYLLIFFSRSNKPRRCFPSWPSWEKKERKETTYLPFRERSQTKLTSFLKSQHFWTVYLPLLVNVVCERPLTRNTKVSLTWHFQNASLLLAPQIFSPSGITE